MSDITLIEEPTRTETRLVWVTKGEGEDWGTLHDSVYPDRTFAPNRLCVVVTSSGRDTFSTWMQAREHYYGDPTRPHAELCRGAQDFNGRFPDWAPQWAYDARDLAVQSVADLAGT